MAIAYSGREREFTFAENCNFSNIRWRKIVNLKFKNHHYIYNAFQNTQIC